MKKLLLLFSLVVLLSACEGNQGPPGVNIVAQSFERTVDFGGPDYTTFIPFPLGIEAFPNDMVLVYRLQDEVPAANGGTVDVWTLLPQIFYTTTGEEFQYNFNATSGDVELLMDAPDRTLLDVIEDRFVLGQTFRIVVLPVSYINGVDLSDMNAVMSAAGLTNADIQ
ncbi:MAG: dihydrolipoamide dehydrogenase [Nonlabens sp.]